MTALAFTAVIALLTVMMAFVNGMQRLTEGTGQPGNVLVLADGATDEVFSNLTIGDSGESRTCRTWSATNGRPLASRETYLVVNQPIPNAGRRPAEAPFLQLRGIEDPLLAATVHDLELLPGGSGSPRPACRKLPRRTPRSGRRGTAIQAVLGEGVAHELGRDRTPEELAAAKNRRPARRRRHFHPRRPHLDRRRAS